MTAWTDTHFDAAYLLWHRPRTAVLLAWLVQGRSDGGGGGISVYIPPKSVTVLFTCGILTRFEIAMTSQDVYLPPNQIPGYATGLV